jgi:hypothetical protein
MIAGYIAYGSCNTGKILTVYQVVANSESMHLKKKKVTEFSYNLTSCIIFKNIWKAKI